MIHIKKNIISKTNSELLKKQFSQKLKCIDVSSEDKSIQFDDMKRFQHGIVLSWIAYNRLWEKLPYTTFNMLSLEFRECW
jgi:hypothetical protein